MLGWDFSKLSTDEFETRTFEIGDAYTNISLNAKTADIQLLPAQDGKTTVVCYQQTTLRHTAAVAEGTLEITVNDTRKWTDYIGIHFTAPTITLYIPQGAYGDLNIVSDTGAVQIPKDFSFHSIHITENTGAVTSYASATDCIDIQTTTGSIHLATLSADTVKLRVSTGKITATDLSCTGDVSIHVSTGKTFLQNLSCRNLISDGSTGDILLQNAIAREQFSIERSTGDVEFDRCDAGTITVKTDTGKVTGTLLTDKVFTVKTDTGTVRVPQSATGGKCAISTDTGNIIITVDQ